LALASVSRTVVAFAFALTGCTSSLEPGRSALAEVQAAMGTPAERRQFGAETWLYYPSQPFGRKVSVARLAPDGKLIALEQRLTEEFIAKLVPNQSRREDVLALFGQPFERVTYPRLQREAWSWHMRIFTNRPAGLHVQMSPDGVVREVYVIDEDDQDNDRDRR
jgi:outer membrane protein assembly factor BamE (lipoprotein component of BamABCDE complex)